MMAQHSVASEESASMIAEAAGGDFTVEQLDQLMPLPTPHLKRMRQEAAAGVLTVLSFCITINSLTAAVINFCQTLNDSAVYTCFAIMSTLTIAALVCLCGLMFGDPGIIKRSAETCFPLPDSIIQRLSTGRFMDDLSNVTAYNPEGLMSSKTFCVRCLVWRQPGGHHCKTCQRCVKDFDHHCGVFGRCIAGKILPAPSGNWPYFTAIIFCAWSGAVCGMAFGGSALVYFIQKMNLEGKHGQSSVHS
jgi:hypothetical protein